MVNIEARSGGNVQKEEPKLDNPAFVGLGSGLTVANRMNS